MTAQANLAAHRAYLGVKPVIWPCCWWWPHTGAAAVGLPGRRGCALIEDRYFQGVLLFSLKQAALSAVLSVLLAWPVARALYYRPELRGRMLFLSLCLLCFVLPTLILITGLVALLGRSGWLTPWLGESGICMACTGFCWRMCLNLPFAVRALYQQLLAIPDTSWRLAAQLKLGAWQRWRLVEWPALRTDGCGCWAVCVRAVF
ncbi:MAG: hypothetical protein R3E95_03370 [Thiolinea sp.]